MRGVFFLQGSQAVADILRNIPRKISMLNYQGVRVLLVEDDELDRRAVERSLRRASEFCVSEYTVNCVDRLELATQFLSENQTDVILLDLSLPDTHGLDGLVNIRKLYPSVPVIVLTGLNSEENALEALHLGAQDYMIKGGESRTLTRVIHYAIERHGMLLELEEAKKGAAAASVAKSAFLANMSHEIRTPLSAIIGFADALRSITLSAKEQKLAIEVIYRNGKHLLQIIEDILDVSRIEAGRLEVHIAETNIFEIFDDLNVAMKLKAGQKGVFFAFDYNFPLPTLVKTDALRLKQILFNLISNAIKFTLAGTVRVCVRCDRENERLEFLIKDSGIGISSGDLEKLFQPFSQVDTTGTRKFGGTGLGLVISKELCEKLGGSIHVESEVDKGSQFGFFVSTGPLENAEFVNQFYRPRSNDCETLVNQCPEANTIGRVLLVEDGPDNQRLADFLLRRMGADVVIKENGKEALDCAMQEHFDLILMDMQMPVMDGYVATRELRNRGFNLPIIALTASAMSGTDKKCLDAGCTEYLSKPFDQKKFLSVIGKYLKRTPNQPLCKSDDIVSSLENEDPEFARIVASFVSNLKGRIDEFEKAFANHDWKQVQLLAHRLKGAAAGHGYSKLSELSAELEAIIESDSLENIDGSFARLKEMIAMIHESRSGAIGKYSN